VRGVIGLLAELNQRLIEVKEKGNHASKFVIVSIGKLWYGYFGKENQHN
jgi:hypothetical protein